MSMTESSRRVNLAKDQHATATGTERMRNAHKSDNSRPTQPAQSHPGYYTKSEAAQRAREAHYRIERTSQQQQAARFFWNMSRGCNLG